MSETPGFDAREGSGDIESDPAAMGEVSFSEPDADGGAVPDAGRGPVPDEATDADGALPADPVEYMP